MGYSGENCEECRTYPGVNFINILHRNFALIFWWQKLQSWNVTRESSAKHFRTKNACVKCLWNWLQVSISPTIYDQIFCTKLFCAALAVQLKLEQKLLVKYQHFMHSFCVPRSQKCKNDSKVIGQFALLEFTLIIKLVKLTPVSIKKYFYWLLELWTKKNW